MAEYQTVKITSMVLDQNTGKLLGYKDDAGNFYPAPEEDGKQPSPEQAVSAMQAQQAQVPQASADVTRMHVPQAQPAQAVPAMMAAPAAPQAPVQAQAPPQAAPQRRSLKFPENPVAAKPVVTQYTQQPPVVTQYTQQTYSTTAPQTMLPPQYASAPTHYVEPQPTNFSYVPPVVQQPPPQMMHQPPLQQGSYVPPPLPAAMHPYHAAFDQAPIHAQAMQPYQAPMAQAQIMQPPLQQGSYVPPPMDMGMQMPGPMPAMPVHAMPVQAVPAQMPMAPMPFMHGMNGQEGAFMPGAMPGGMPGGMPGAMPGGMPEGFHVAPHMGLPEGFHAPPHMMGPPHDMPGYEGFGQHEANPFLMGGGAMPGMHGPPPMPGMGMPHGGMPMGMPQQVMGAHPSMGAAPVAGETAIWVMGAHPSMGAAPVAGFSGFGGMPGGQPMGAPPGFGGMPMQHGMPMAGAAYGGYSVHGAMPPSVMPPVGGGGA